MVCPNCGFDNPSGTVFCAQCGRSLSRGGEGVGTYLVWQSEDGTPHAVAINRSMTIGRTDGNDIVIHDSAMSRQHARVEPSPNGVAVVDLGSLNGVYVNSERIVEPVDLRHSDVVRIGRTELTVRIADPVPSPPQTAPPQTGTMQTGTLRLETPLDLPAVEVEEEEDEAAGAATIMMGGVGNTDGVSAEEDAGERTIMASASGNWPAPTAAPEPEPEPAEPQPAGHLVADDIRLPMYDAIQIGRAEGNDLRIENDRMISRHHAQMNAREDGIWLEDLNSANGTFVNGVRVTSPVPVVDGDEIRFGSSTYFWEAATPPAPPEPVVPEHEYASAETLVAQLPAGFGLSAPEDSALGTDILPAGTPPPPADASIDSGATIVAELESGATIAPVEEEEEEDIQLQTLRGSEADLYIREAVAAEFELIRKGETEPFKTEGADATDQHRLVVNFGAEAGRQFLLYKDVTIIGRTAVDADYDIQLNDRAISRPHARIVKDRDGCVIYDMESANGTIINYTAEIKEPRRLKDGDIIKLGKTTLVYRVPASFRPELPTPVYDPGIGQIITSFSLKGGVGTTTIAVNTAVLLRQLTGQPVLLIDLSTERGALSVHLNLSPKLTIADLPNDPAAIDVDVLQTVIERHDSGVDVLPAPPTPQTAELVTPSLVSAILPIVRDRYKWIVIDTSATFSELNLGVFDQSDLFLLVLAPDLASVKVMQSALDVFAALQVAAEKRVLVWNQTHLHPHLEKEDVERTLGERIAFTVPNGADALLDSIDRGVPLAIGDPTHATVGALRTFCESLAHVTQTAEKQARKGGFGQWVQGLISSVRR